MPYIYIYIYIYIWNRPVEFLRQELAEQYGGEEGQVFSLLALLVQKYKY
jgi:hypothetical protein